MNSKNVKIVSESAPQSGQKERSSNNFTTADFGKDCSLIISAFYYYDVNSEEAKAVSFDIKVDKSGKDSVYLQSVKSGSCHMNTDDRNLYIANPSGAEREFTVVIESGVLIKSGKEPQSGQKHRASENFSTKGFGEKSTIQFFVYYDYGTENQKTASDITFKVQKDITAGKDTDVWTEVKHGSCKDNEQSKQLYIADPKGAEKEFTIIIKEQ